MGGRAGELAIQPGFRAFPLAHHGDRRNAQHFGGFLDAQAAEEAQLDDFRLPRRPRRQRVQGIVQGAEIIGAIGAQNSLGIERDMLGVRAPLRIAPPCLVDEDAAHGLRRCRHAVSPVLPLHVFVVDEPHVGFIDQRRRLQAVAGPLALQVVVRQTMELVVHNRGQPIERALVAVGPCTEQGTDVLGESFTRARALRHVVVAALYRPSPFLRLIALPGLLRLFPESPRLNEWRAEGATYMVKNILWTLLLTSTLALAATETQAQSIASTGESQDSRSDEHSKHGRPRDIVGSWFASTA